jgi:hypothetical protein
MDKENVVHVLNGVLFACEKKQKYAISWKID